MLVFSKDVSQLRLLFFVEVVRQLDVINLSCFVFSIKNLLEAFVSVADAFRIIDMKVV